MSPRWRQAFVRRFECRFRLDEPLSRHTTLRVGGPAELMAWVDSPEQLVRVRQWLDAKGVPWRVLGGGSNVLVSDDGIEGAVLRLDGKMKGFRTRREGAKVVRLEAGAATSLARLVRWSTSNNLAGLHGLWGIPGTLGGAIKGNAGTRLGSVSDCLVRMCVAEASGLRWLDSRSARFGYRRSAVGKRRVVVAATLELKPVTPARMKTLLERVSRLREGQPRAAATAGCFFRNPRQAPAGLLIERAGMKGARLGGAVVSARHANFIVNTGGATALQIWTLARRVAVQVKKQFGVTLEREVDCWGPFSSGRKA